MAIDSIDTASPPADEVVPARGLSFRAIAIGAFLLLLIGVAGGGWAVNRWLTGQNVPPARMIGAPAAPTLVAGGTAKGTAGQPLAVTPVDGANALAARVAELEQRLSRITLEAESASGNASRAEGLLVAFAVRRALDRGLSLGYLDAQLRLRFGDDQPNAVKTIIDTSREPVTLEQLRAELDAMAPQLVGRGGDDNGSLWTGLRRELGELFVVRAAGTQSPRASERLDRARRYLAAGQADLAIAEVEAMPGSDVASDWLIAARRYHEARRALDLIETAAILEPRDSPAAAMARKTAEPTP
ncbi:outer membrane murein-binding lipoprotein Lpp [Sphingopyxis sp. OAS728]|uniref:mitofilin family membrane protein n=1 Tax=Sphingopyxis sp. OAS728 TaxID=2663823 RepID=UPI00178BF5A9|nr:mitofilin family membrane protein [Sphingopyxis sp. OAS728]MBE1528260.1 outer membrane murein-binding lipoprotein Lpp [Sphingopyxis sp. OAS728]